MQEVWKTIPSFPDYEASNLGQIRRAKPSKAPCNTYIGKILKPTVATNGYLYVSPNCIKRMVHCLVAEAFHGLRPNGLVINHIDRNIINNHADNLEYCTQKQNLEHSDCNRCRGPKHKNSKYSIETITEVKKLLKTNVKQRHTAKQFNMTFQQVNAIALGHTWKWLIV